MSGAPAQGTAVAAPAAAASVPESPGGAVPAATPIPAGALCENCAAPVTGPYCAQCGQKHGHSINSVWHFLREVTEDLTHADSRLWLTLAALLARPGALTREFLDGHRVRYLPPLRLYLVVSLVFFVLNGLTNEPVTTTRVSVGGFSITPPPKGVTVTPVPPAQIDAVCQSSLEEAQPVLTRIGLGGRVLASCHKLLLDGGTSFLEALQHNVERGMFVFLPLLALFAWLLYWRPRHYYVEHLLFFVHNHTVLFLVLALKNVVTLVLPAALKSAGDLLGLAIAIYLAWYLFSSMRRVYGQGRILTLAKLVLLIGVYGVTSIVGYVLTMFYSLLTL